MTKNRCILCLWILAAVVLTLLLCIAISQIVRSRGRIAASVEPTTAPATQATALRIGLTPEGDVFDQRRRYTLLCDYLAARLGRPVELRTLKSYQVLLDDLAHEEVDLAFVGSLVAVLAIDQQGAKVLVRPQTTDGISTYHGVIVVPADSPIRTIEDLRGKSVALVRATTAGCLFFHSVLQQHNLLDAQPPVTPRPVGTHDQVILELVAGHVDAGSVKNLRLDAFERQHPELSFRRLAQGKEVPNNGLIVRADLADELAAPLTNLLLKMTDNPEGKSVLAGMGLARFIPCPPKDYEPVVDMTERLGSIWNTRMGFQCVPPTRKSLGLAPDDSADTATAHVEP